MGLRQEKKQLLRREILDAAITLFRERGYDATRVRDIIGRLRISEATFFNYFPTKDTVLHEFAFEMVEGYTTVLQYELSSADRSVPDRIREMMRLMALAISNDRDFMTVVFTRSRLFAATGLLKEKTLRMYDVFAELFRVGQVRGEIRDDVDPMQLAEALTGIYQMTITNWLTGWWEISEELEPRLMRAIDLFLDGCRSGQQP
jgi:AcrR family transcriptional regulator